MGWVRKMGWERERIFKDFYCLYLAALVNSKAGCCFTALTELKKQCLGHKKNHYYNIIKYSRKFEGTLKNKKHLMTSLVWFENIYIKKL